MNTNIRVSCPDCGELQITEQDIDVVCLSTRWSYNFRCPRCNMRNSKWVGKNVVDLVIDVGVTPRWLSVPLELFESKCGEPINVDDVIEFSVSLRSWDGSRDKGTAS